CCCRAERYSSHSCGVDFSTPFQAVQLRKKYGVPSACSKNNRSSESRIGPCCASGLSVAAGWTSNCPVGQPSLSASPPAFQVQVPASSGQKRTRQVRPPSQNPRRACSRPEGPRNWTTTLAVNGLS